MTGVRHLLAFTALLAAPGVATALPSDDALATQVEHALLARRPDVRLQHYARFYAHLPGERIRAVFVHESFSLGVERPRARSWVSGDALPHIDDGGCVVAIDMDYDARTGRLDLAECNGSPG